MTHSRTLALMVVLLSLCGVASANEVEVPDGLSKEDCAEYVRDRTSGISPDSVMYYGVQMTSGQYDVVVEKCGEPKWDEK